MQPHQQRVVDEKYELDERLAKLTTFIFENPLFKKQSNLEKQLMHRQRLLMSGVLASRIALFPKSEE